MKKILSMALAALLLVGTLGGCSTSGGENGKLVLYTWENMFPQEVLDGFTQETGISVTYSNFDTDETMLARLEAAEGGDYDLVIADDYIIETAIQEGLVQELDTSKLENYGSINPVYQGQFYDPENKYTVPYGAGVQTIVYDPSAVDVEIKGYADLWDASLEDNLGIIDNFRVVNGMALKVLGESYNTEDTAAIEAAGPGQVLVPSFQGSRVEGMSEEEYIADHATTARLVKETGAKLMVMNTSCPNEGHNRLLCHNPLLVGRITEAVKQEIGDIPLMVKLAYIPSDGDLELMVRSTVGHGTVQGFSTINTISAKLVDANGNQALPGAGRDRSGVCGNAIRGAGLDMVARLAAIREKLGLDFKINGVGGVVSPADYQAYRNAGADSVMSATGAMWDAELAHKIKASR